MTPDKNFNPPSFDKIGIVTNILSSYLVEVKFNNFQSPKYFELVQIFLIDNCIELTRFSSALYNNTIKKSRESRFREVSNLIASREEKST